GLTEVSALLGQGKPRAEGEDLASALLPGPASPPPSDAAASGPGGPETAGASVPGGSSPALAFRATQPSPQSEEPEASGEALRDPAELPRPEGPRQEAGAAHDAGGRVLRAVVATGRAPSAPSLLEQVRFVLQPDLNQARVRLDPPGLGNLLVDVREVEGELSAQIQVERPEVLREIERLLPQLHEAFLRNGQALTRIEVSLNLQGFTDADAQGHEQQPSSGWERDEALSTPPPPSLAGPARALTLRLAPRAGLDTLA
ncbi:MAG: flagellar hook-length control protein FliK, partial [Planctomycetes bacterium]|nr:flagellar hook-length control protein FliK [Planctomycetota bacterium]